MSHDALELQSLSTKQSDAAVEKLGGKLSADYRLTVLRPNIGFRGRLRKYG